MQEKYASIYEKNIRIQNLKATGKLNGAVPSHANDSSVIELEYCDNCIVDNVEVLASDDSCIRISGYKRGIVSFESILTNPDFGFSHNNTVSNCRVSGGYIGIEFKPCTDWATPLNHQMLTALREDAGATPHKNIRTHIVTGKQCYYEIGRAHV